MENVYLCPDCGAEHDEPAEAILGHRVRCLDCLLELELADEFEVLRPIAA